MADVIIIAAVAAGIFFAARSLAHGEGECSTCGSVAGCQARATGKGHCAVAQDMVAKADAAFAADRRETDM